MKRRTSAETLQKLKSCMGDSSAQLTCQWVKINGIRLLNGLAVTHFLRRPQNYLFEKLVKVSEFKLTSMAWVYCSSLSSILETGSGACVFFILLLEGGKMVERMFTTDPTFQSLITIVYSELWSVISTICTDHIAHWMATWLTYLWLSFYMNPAKMICKSWFMVICICIKWSLFSSL